MNKHKAIRGEIKTLEVQHDYRVLGCFEKQLGFSPKHSLSNDLVAKLYDHLRFQLAGELTEALK